MSKAQILFFGPSDYANCANRWSRAINENSNLFSSRVVSIDAHPFHYKEDIIWSRHTEDQVVDLMHSCDIVCITHTVPSLFHAFGIRALEQRQYGLLKLLPTKQLAIIHPGSAYRTTPRAFDEIDGIMGIRLRFIGPDLWGDARKNLAYLNMQFPYPQTVDEEDRNRNSLDQSKASSDKVVFLHIPSNHVNKGTSKIREYVREYDWIQYKEHSGLEASAALNQKMFCDVYVDQVSPEIGGYGMSAIEAMAHGKPVIASINKITPYRDEIEQFMRLPPILSVSDYDSFRVAAALVRMDLDGLTERTREWYNQHSSGAAVSAWLDDKFSKLLNLSSKEL